MARRRDDDDRREERQAQRNAFLPPGARTGTEETTTSGGGNKKKKKDNKKQPKKINPDSPFAKRRQRIRDMDPGKEKKQARQKLNADLRRRQNIADRRQAQRDSRLAEYDPQPGGGYYDPQTGIPYPDRPFQFNQNPEQGYNWFMTNRVGINPFGQDAVPDDFDRFLQDEYNTVFSEFGEALIDRKNLGFEDFLEKNLASGDLSAKNLRKKYFSKSPFQRAGATGGATSSRWVPWG